jgi:hypothetical protein
MSSSRCSTLRDFLALMLAFRAQNIIWYHQANRSQVEGCDRSFIPLFCDTLSRSSPT